MNYKYDSIVYLLKKKYSNYLGNTLALLESADLHTIIQVLLPEYRLYIFKQISQLLSPDDYCRGLKYAYTKTLGVNSKESKLSLEEILDLFKMADPKKIMGEDYRRFLKFPNEVTIYRGTNENGDSNAISWTIDRKRAIWFYKKYGSKGTVFKAKIKKEDIICYLDKTACFEKEAIINPQKIFQLVELSKDEIDKDIDFSSLDYHPVAIVNYDYVINATRYVVQSLANIGIMPTQELISEIFNSYATRGKYKSNYVIDFPSGECIKVYDLLVKISGT